MVNLIKSYVPIGTSVNTKLFADVVPAFIDFYFDDSEHEVPSVSRNENIRNSSILVEKVEQVFSTRSCTSE